MRTSYFANREAVSSPQAVAICLSPPRWFKGRVYGALAPSWELLNAYKEKRIGDREYEGIYANDVLSRLDPEEVFRELGPDAVLLCWEAPDKFCHRRLVAEWLEKNLGIEVPEMKNLKEIKGKERDSI